MILFRCNIFKHQKCFSYAFLPFSILFYLKIYKDNLTHKHGFKNQQDWLILSMISTFLEKHDYKSEQQKKNHGKNEKGSENVILAVIDRNSVAYVLKQTK